MSTLQFIFGLMRKFNTNEYFPLAIPLFACELTYLRRPSCAGRYEPFAACVGAVPHLVRKVAFPTPPLQGSLTIVNKLF